MTMCRLDPSNRHDVRRYIEFPFRLYRESSLWVPPFVNEVRTQLDPRRHPFYQHSEAAFFLALEGDEVVGRIAVLDNARHNEYHGKRSAFFYHFDVVNEQAVSRALFDAAFDWARGRGLDLMWAWQGTSFEDDGSGRLGPACAAHAAPGVYIEEGLLWADVSLSGD